MADNNKAKQIINNSWLIVFVLVFATFLLEYFSCGFTAMRVYQDDMGFMAGVAKLAGFNWNEAISLTKYYGPCYYIFYFLVFKYVKDPLLIRNILIAGNGFVLALSSGILFFTLRNIFEKIGKWWLAFASGATVFSIIKLETTLSNEYMNVCILSLIVFLLVKYFKSTKKKFKIVIAAFVVLSLIYAVSIHSRNVVLLIGILVCIVWSAIKKQVSIKEMIIWGAIMIVPVICYKVLPSLFIRSIWVNISHTKNASVDAADMLSRVSSLKEFNLFLITIVGNFDMTIKNTFGVVLIGLYLYVLDLIKLGIRKINNEELVNEWPKHIALTFSIVCYGLGMVGTSMSWRGNPKGMGYWRYYGLYILIFFAISMVSWFSEKQTRTKIIGYIGLIYVVVSKLFLVNVWPIVEKTRYYTYGIIDWMKSLSIEHSMMLLISIIIISAVVAALIFKKRILFIVIVSLGIILPSVQFPYLNKVECSGVADQSLKIMNEYREREDIEWYYYGEDDTYLYFQYLLLDKKMGRDIPDDNKGTIVVFFNNPELFEENDDLDIISLDVDEYIYTNNEKIKERLIEDGYRRYR